MPQGRLSMAGPLRASTATNLRPSGLGGVGGLADQFAQMSIAGSRQTSGGQIAQGGMAGGRQTGSFAGNSRRSSSLASRQSLLPTAGPQLTKDPRNLRDKAWQSASVKQLLNFLLTTGYPHPISQKQLQSPSQKDFQNIFRHILEMIDPHFEFTPTKKFEEEVPLIMKSLKYPFADQITKSHMISVGSMHSWPTCLGILMWMVELALASEHVDPLQQPPDLLDSGTAQDPAVMSERTFFDYVLRAYDVFLAGGDNFEPMDQDFSDFFDRRNGAVLRDIERLQKQSEDFETALARLGDGAEPLAELQVEGNALQVDIGKYSIYNQHQEKKLAAEREALQASILETKTKEDELANLIAERTRVQAIVDAQEIRPEDVDRMNAEKDSLARQFQATTAKGEELTQMAWDAEISGQKVFDRLEKKVQDYNAACDRMDLLDPSSKNAAGVRYELELNPQPRSKEDVGSVDLEGVVRPAMLKLMDALKERIRKADEEVLALQEKRDRTLEQTSVKGDEVHDLELKFKRLADEYAREFEVSKEESASANAEAEKLEETLKKLKADLNAGLKEAQERKKSLMVEFLELERLSEEILAQSGGKMTALVEAIIDYRDRTSRSLDQLIDSVKADGEDVLRVAAGGVENPVESVADVESERSAMYADTMPGAPLVVQGGTGVGAFPMMGVSVQLPELQTPRTPRSKSRGRK
ncbi:hypothetical protein M427DRAFT_152741 [Gonapodya prolifera JEL478]|uniref:Kinetochore protein NDC80 n=1 Tax=Gonapodya prolifera (strain JEL478) TaxID=1344416 RepID=A0A139AS23_GONPJ|nr:hypothetical protein M427DRAFT_152741 [Gonapodya prolifera JEL478]|eukprot:KXS19265.1 hypothetical protein M427DRAFT_152741 [Gonapodya prolifera JEL478]